MRVTSALLVSSLLVASVSAIAPLNWGADRKTDKCDVVVVGGGAAGANAAVFAMDKGYQRVCIVEKTGDIGGHCDTHILDPSTVPASCPYNTLFGGRCPFWIDTGVLIWQDTKKEQELGYADYNFDFINYAARMGGAENVTRFNVHQFVTGRQYWVDLNHNLDLTPFLTSTTPAGQAAVFQALLNLQFVLARYPWLDQAGVYPDPIPAELLLPMTEFFPAFNLTALFGPFLNLLLSQNGYGSYDNINALYALLSLRKGILNLYGVLDYDVPTDFMMWGGCDTLYHGVEQYVGLNNIFYNAQVTKITRSGQDFFGDDDNDDGNNRPIRVQFNYNGQVRVIKAKKLIYAAIPNKDNTQVFTDLSANEQDLFSKVRSRYYAVALLKNTQGLVFNQNVAANVITGIYNLNNYADPFFRNPSPGLIHYTQFWPYAPLQMAFQADTPQPLATTQAQLNAAINQTVTESASNYLISHTELDTINVHDQYQGYFSSADLAVSPTPYTRFNRLQGQKNTIWLGATITYAESSKVIAHAFDTVNAYL